MTNPTQTREDDGRPASVFALQDGLRVLALGAHADDVELGCGATLLYLKARKRAEVRYVIFCRDFEEPAHLVRVNEIEKSTEMMKVDKWEVLDFPDTELPNAWRTVQLKMKELQRDYRPDLVFAPRLNDNHQDHVVVAEGASREFRRGEALWHYEIKQYGQDVFDANLFIDIGGSTGRASLGDPDFDSGYRAFLDDLGSPDESAGPAPDTFAHLKTYILRESMVSQRHKPFMHPEMILGTMRVRGMQASPHTSYAEAFSAKVAIPREK